MTCTATDTLQPYPEDGNGIVSETTYFVVTETDTAPRASVAVEQHIGEEDTYSFAAMGEDWSETAQTPTETYKYLWACRYITYTKQKPDLIGPYLVATYSKNGDDGNGIKSEETYFAVTTTATAPSATILEERRNDGKHYMLVSDDDTEWDSVAPPLTATNKYLWACRFVQYTQASPTLIGPYIAGTYGETGDSGKVPYPAGAWDATITYTPTDRTTPYVERGGQYYILVKTTESQGEDPASEDYSDVWKHMDNFQYMLVNALVAKLARVGAAVFYEDFMMSQYGYHDNTGDTNYTPSEPATWEQLVNYALYGTEGCAKFVPELLVDFKNGRLFAQDACIKGTIYATNGSFQGKVTATEGSFINGTISNCTMEDCKATRGTFEDVTVTGAITCSKLEHKSVVAKEQGTIIYLTDIECDTVVNYGPSTMVFLPLLADGICREYLVLNYAFEEGNMALLNLNFNVVLAKDEDGLEIRDSNDVYYGPAHGNVTSVSNGVYKVYGTGAGGSTEWHIIKVSAN